MATPCLDAHDGLGEGNDFGSVPPPPEEALPELGFTQLLLAPQATTDACASHSRKHTSLYAVEKVKAALCLTQVPSR